jgi:hypothetical protein
MNPEMLLKSFEYTIITITTAVVSFFVLIYSYDKLFIEENSTWRFAFSLGIIIILLTAMYYFLFYEGVL